MNPVDAKLKQEAAAMRLENAAGEHAAALPLPGPTLDIFAPRQNIKVDKYDISPFYDVHFEYLQLLDHPFASCAVGDTSAVESFKPRGPLAWQLFWVLSRPFSEVEAALKDSPAKAKQLAQAEFGGYQLGAQLALYRAVVQQFQVYAESIIGVAPNDAPAKTDKKDDKGASAKLPPSPAA